MLQAMILLLLCRHRLQVYLILQPLQLDLHQLRHLLLVLLVLRLLQLRWSNGKPRGNAKPSPVPMRFVIS